MRLIFTAIAGLLQASALFAQQSLSAEIDREVRTLQRAYNVPGLSVVVVQGNQVILCKGYGESNVARHTAFTSDTPARLASATKFLTSLGMIAEAHKGTIDLDARLDTYLQGLQPEWASIPVYQLLNLTSGIPGTEKTPFDGLTTDEQRRVSEGTLFEMLRNLPLESRPGERWAYRQTGYMTASLIIGRQTGKSWQDILREDILLPAGTTNTGHNDATAYAPGLEPKNYVHDEVGTFVDAPMFFPLVLATGAGYNTSAHDLSRIFLAINAHKILSPELLARYEFNTRYMFPTGGDEYYSLASEVKRVGPFRTIGHSGGPDLADIRYSPDKQVGVAVLANRNNTGISAELTTRILRRVLLDSAFDAQKRPIGMAIRGLVGKSSDEQLAAFYEQNRHNPKYHYEDSERDLNSAGYELLGSADIPDALKIFRLIVQVFPQSANAFDSLGEAYLKAGDKPRALANYKKAYALNPNNEHAKEVVAQLSGQH
jgi:CubicO group peptidase (beta-lactamase class C family)